MPKQPVLPATAEPEATAGRIRSALIAVLQTVFDEGWVGQQRFTTRAELDALHAALNAGTGAHVLDIGSGLGGPAIYLARQMGCRVTGIEASAEHVRAAADAGADAGVADRVRFVAGEVVNAGFPLGAFDGIVSHDAFVTVANKRRLFALCRRWLRPGGRLAAALIVSRAGLAGVADRPCQLAWPIPTADGYRALAEQAGLRVLGVDDLSMSFREVSARWRGALMVWDLALLPAIRHPDWQRLHATTGRLAEWATQGLLGHIRLIAQHPAPTS
jgi:SAM-dependent methyltransferase